MVIIPTMELEWWRHWSLVPLISFCLCEHPRSMAEMSETLNQILTLQKRSLETQQNFEDRVGDSYEKTRFER